MFSDVTISLLLMRLAAVIVIAAIQGAASAGTVVLLGDRGPQYDGRLTLLPFRHLDLVGTVCIVVFGLGWIRPLDIDTRRFRAGQAGVVLVVVSGFVALLVTANTLLALILPAIEHLSYTAGITIAATLRIAARLCLSVALFNLLPIPPLNAGHLLAAIGVKPSRQVRLVLVVCLMVAIATGFARALIAPVYELLAPFILGSALAGG